MRVQHAVIFEGKTHTVLTKEQRYAIGRLPPNYPMPAIRQIHQWDYYLWCLLADIPPLSEEDWDREEELWENYLDSLD